MMNKNSSLLRNSFFYVLLVLFLTSCSVFDGDAKKLSYKSLGVNIPMFNVKKVWSTKIGINNTALALRVNDINVAIASADGVIAVIDGRTGADVWRVLLKESLTAGVGSDGHSVAVVSSKNDVVLLESGSEKWRQRLTTQVFTSPLVAGGRVFVLTADRSIIAFDVKDGRRLWIQQNSGDSLALRHPGILMAVNETLVAGVSGRLLGLNPDSGSVHWDAPLSIPRGTNDIERLVELVEGASRVNDSICVRSFQSVVGCIDTLRGTVSWSQKAAGFYGVDGDASSLYGSESNGNVIAWNRENGSRAWTSDRLQHRRLTAPLLLGRSVVFGDDGGELHFLSRDDGSPLNRLSTDSSGISVTPVVVADTLVVVSRAGYVYGFRPD